MSRNVSILSAVAAVVASMLTVVTVAFAAPNGGGLGQEKNEGGLGQEKVTLCHKGHTITVGAPAVAAHQNHGDILGECGQDAGTSTTGTTDTTTGTTIDGVATASRATTHSTAARKSTVGWVIRAIGSGIATATW